MFWADRIAEDIEKRFSAQGRSALGGGPIVIRDEKTMSGWAHIGSMLSAAIHGVVSEVLEDRGVKNFYFFEFNDMDAFDSIPVYLERKGLEEHLGKSLRDIPSPDRKAKNYAAYFADDFRKVIEGTGFKPTLDFSSEWYFSGKMDNVIREAINGADAIRRIYKEVSGGERVEEWLPILVRCPLCGKIATTEASEFDGETVKIYCAKNKVAWVKGCGFEGRTSPFGGNAKLPWKVEWAAKWKVRGVNVEGGGKDHSTRGGAHEVAARICHEVFHYEVPFFFAHEFFLVGGKKISSSKGLGSTARAIFELLPPKMFRLSLIGKDINQQRNFNPEGDSIPTLYDQYDKLAEGYWSGAKDDYARLFELLHSERKVPAKSILPRFSQVAFIVQMPHLNLHSEFPGADSHELQERATYAKKWLELYAPEKYIFKLQEKMPTVALSEKQKNVLAVLADYIEGEKELSGEQLHHRLHEIKEEQHVAPAELFSAVYLIFLGKSQGPQAGWFLASLGKSFVLKRLREGAL